MAPPSATPASTPISKPPTLARTSRGSPGSGAFTSSASDTTRILRASCAGVRPVPRPVVCAGGLPVNAATIALDEVVLPMPISPVPIRSAPDPAASTASSMPAPMHCSACSRDMAGPCVMSPVPLPIFRLLIPGTAGSSPATPASTTIRSTPRRLVSTLMAAPSARMLRTICAVTSRG